MNPMLETLRFLNSIAPIEFPAEGAPDDMAGDGYGSRRKDIALIALIEDYVMHNPISARMNAMAGTAGRPKRTLGVASSYNHPLSMETTPETDEILYAGRQRARALMRGFRGYPTSRQ